MDVVDLPRPTGVNQRAAVAMSPAEVHDYLRAPRSATVSTLSGDGSIHSVAMWYAFLDDTIYMEAKAKSQKVVNLRRDNRMTVLVHDGDTYSELRGVMLSGAGDIVEDEAVLRRIIEDVFLRYHGGAAADEQVIGTLLRNRVALRLHAKSIASWDHRKL